MKSFLKLCFVFTLFSSLYANEELKSYYETHLPKEIYLYCKKYHLIDENCPENFREQPGPSKALNLLTLKVDVKDGEPILVIDYLPAEIEDNFGGIQLGYQNQKLSGYAIFDAEGNDYVALAPPAFSEHDETVFATFILDKIFPIFAKK